MLQQILYLHNFSIPCTTLCKVCFIPGEVLPIFEPVRSKEIQLQEKFGLIVMGSVNLGRNSDCGTASHPVHIQFGLFLRYLGIQLGNLLIQIIQLVVGIS